MESSAVTARANPEPQVYEELVGWRDSVANIIRAGKFLKAKRQELSSTEFTGFVRAQMLVDRSAAEKLINVADNKVLSDPQNYDKLLPQWAKLYELSRMPDDKLEAVVRGGTATTINKYKIWELRGGRVGKGAGIKKGTVVVPDGKTLLQAANDALELEKTGLPPEKAAKKIGLAALNYRRVRAVIKLTERTDLSYQDMALAKFILGEMDRTRKVSELYEEIRPIVDKVWGESRSNRDISVEGKAEKRRKESFNNALVVICDTCNNGADIEIPYLSEEEISSAINRVIEARNALQQLAKKLRRA